MQENLTLLHANNKGTDRSLPLLCVYHQTSLGPACKILMF